MTSRIECDIIYKLSQRAVADDPWKLNNRRKIVRIILEIRNYLWNLDNSFFKNSLTIHSKQVRELNHSSDIDWMIYGSFNTNIREFDPGSGWTLAACITHSSRTDKGLRPCVSGGRVSNAWATCLCVWNNVWKRTLIPHNAWRSHDFHAKDLLHRDGLASD